MDRNGNPLNGGAMTFREIAKREGISSSHAQKVVRVALEKLKRNLEAKRLRDMQIGLEKIRERGL